MFGTGPLHVIGTIQKVQSEGDWHSIPGFIGTRLGLSTLAHITSWALAVVFVGVFVWLLRRVWRGELDWVDAGAWSAVALLVTASSLLPWYVAWLIPLAALASDRRLWRVAFVVTGIIQLIQLIGYIPHVGGSRELVSEIALPCRRDGASATATATRRLELLSVVAPVYNEEETLERFYARVCAALEGLRVRAGARRRRVDGPLADASTELAAETRACTSSSCRGTSVTRRR